MSNDMCRILLDDVVEHVGSQCCRNEDCPISLRKAESWMLGYILEVRVVGRIAEDREIHGYAHFPCEILRVLARSAHELSCYVSTVLSATVGEVTYVARAGRL